MDQQAAADAMYAALAAGDKQAYQAAQLAFQQASGIYAPAALAGNPWNLPSPAPPGPDTVSDSAGVPYVNGQPAAAEVIVPPPTLTRSRMGVAPLPASVQPARLEAATGRGALVSADQIRAMFVGAGGIGVGAAAGGPVGLIVGAVFSFLGGLFGGIFGGGDANKAIQQLRDEFTNVSNALIQGFAQLARTVGQILKYLGTLIVEFVKALWAWLKDLVAMLKDLYEKILKPALAAIQKIRQKILDWYNRFMRPVLVILQRIHQVLTILKLFHVKFAAKLDAQLMQLEAKLTQPMYILLGYINQIANMLNLVYDAGLGIRRAVILNALDSTKGSWTQMWWNAQTLPGFNPGAGQAAPVTPAQALQSAQQDFATYTTTGGGPIAANVSAMQQSFDQFTQGR